MDWDEIHTKRLAARCLQAGADLGIEVTAPFILQREERQIRFVAHFPGFGGPLGTLVILSSLWHELHELAAREGYTCVGLYPEQFSMYDRSQWERIFSEWGPSTKVSSGD